MINIHNRCWVVKGVEREVEGTDSRLAYMTHTEYNKADNKPSAAFEKRMGTGMHWAKGYGNKRKVNEKDDILTFDNVPTSGFKVCGMAARWSTQNKVIQVEDPRGFVVEIPTGNLTTMMKYVTIINSVVQDECVWGKEGNNHILLPTNSDIYQQGVLQTKQKNTRVDFNKLKIGDEILMNIDCPEDVYVYMGKAKATWLNTQKQAKPVVRRTWFSNGWAKSEDDEVLRTTKFIDTKWCHVFKQVKGDTGYRDDWQYKTAGKAVVVGHTDKLPRKTKFDVYLPERISNKDEFVSYYENHLGVYGTTECIDITWRDK